MKRLFATVSVGIALGVLAVSGTAAAPAKPSYERTWTNADPQSLPGDIDNHIVVSATAPQGAGAYLTGAVVNLHNASGNVELWFDVGNVARQAAIVTANGFSFASFGSEIVRGGQTVMIELRAANSLEIGPDTQIFFTSLQ